MADEQDNEDKTEEPTQRKLEEAIKRGDVVKSIEVNTWFLLMGALMVLAFMSQWTSRDLA